MKNNFTRYLIYFVIGFFALAGLFFILGFWALNSGLFNSSGRVDGRDRYFSDVQAGSYLASKASSLNSRSAAPDCRLIVLSFLSPGVARSWAMIPPSAGAKLSTILNKTEFFWQDNSFYQAGLKTCQQLVSENQKFAGNQVNAYSWLGTEEWLVLKEAITKDQAKINLVTKQTGVPARLIVTMLVGEQLRLYNSEREVYKQVFAPLRILGSQSQFSWGVMGMKEETAEKVELYLKDKQSPYYLGAKFENMLDYNKGQDPSAERFYRLTNDKDHYYSYLYTAIYLKQLLSQWAKAGHPIDDRPEIIATLFNLGFDKSVPKSEPQVGGSEITIAGEDYTFGNLAFQFYYSGELINYFPWIIK